MGWYPELLGIPPSFVLDFFHSFFACFSIPHFFTFLSQNTPQKGAKKCQKAWKSTNKPPPDPAWKPYLQKASPECENRIPFNVLSLFPRVPGTPKSITNWIRNGPRNSKLWAKWVSKKTTKNKPLKSRQLYQKSLKLGTPGAAKVRPNCDPFRNFLHPGPEMGQESSRGPKRVAQDVQKVPKGFQKVAKSHEKTNSKHRCSDRRHRP